MALPLTLIPWAIGGIIGAGGSYMFWRNWDKLKAAVRGKKLVVLGSRNTGKTTLITFLQQGELVTEYEQTLGSKKIKKKKAKRVYLKDLEWHITRLSSTAYDVGGSTDNYRVWQKLAEDADILVYLMRIDHWIKDPEHTERVVERDLAALKDHSKNRNVHIFVIGTFLDLDDHYQELGDHAREAYKDEILQESFFTGIKAMLTHQGQNKKLLQYDTIIGSLVNSDELQKVVTQLFERLRHQ